MSPESAAKLAADWKALGEEIGAQLRCLGTVVKRGLAAQAEQRRRDLDDERDWLGEWGGRRR